MVAVAERLKRVLLGRAISTEERSAAGRGGVGAVASDAISSSAYASQEILVVLAAGGIGLHRYGPWVAAAVVAVVALIVAAYRNVVREFPGGGVDFEVTAKHLGTRSAAVAGSAMLFDFGLTVSVSVAAAVGVLGSLVTSVAEQRERVGVLLVALLMLLSLRGRSRSFLAQRLATLAFISAVGAMVVAAAAAGIGGSAPRAATAGPMPADPGIAAVGGLALVLVLARAFGSGCVAVAGIEQVGSSAPLFGEPRGNRAAAALVVVAGVSMALFVGITALAYLTGARMVPGAQALVVQLADAVFAGNGAATWAVAGATVAVLSAAGVGAFLRFSALSSLIAAAGLLPRQFMARGDRMVHSNGILVLGATSAVAVALTGADLSQLIQLYVIGLFLSLALGQVGMVRHWAGQRAKVPPGPQRQAVLRAQALAGVTAVVSAAVLVVVLTARLTSGAWIVLVLIPLIAAAMLATKQHYDNVFYELTPTTARRDPANSVAAVILVSRIHKPTLRAISYARATRPAEIAAVTVAVDPDEAARLEREWAERDLRVPLVVLESPFRDIATPVLQYVSELRRREPDQLITIYVPEYVVGHWWEELLHNQSAARLKRRLMGLSNVMVVTVPWQLEGAEERADRVDRRAAR